MEEYNSLTILIADDEPLIVEVLSQMIQELGFETILTARDGEQAVDQLTFNAVDLVICDYQMPKMKGTGVLKFIRNHPILKDTPFIMFSGVVPEDIIAEAAEIEVDAYLLKPISKKNLHAKIKQVLGAHAKLSIFERHLASGRAFRLTMRHEKAIEELEKALVQNPSSPRAFLELGLSFEEGGDPIKARRLYEKAIELSPKFLKAHEAIAKNFYDAQNTEKYLFHMDQMSRVNPRNVERNIVIAKTLVQCGRKEEAEKILKKSMDLSTEMYTATAEQIGELFLNMGSAEMAEKSFNKALKANPKSMLSFNKLGIIYRRQGDLEKAIHVYQRGLKEAPDNESMFHNLAIAYYDSGQKDKAVTALQQAIKLNPNFKEAKELLKAYTKNNSS